jgi:hypothetical protein
VVQRPGAAFRDSRRELHVDADHPRPSWLGRQRSRRDNTPGDFETPAAQHVIHLYGRGCCALHLPGDDKHVGAAGSGRDRRSVGDRRL